MLERLIENWLDSAGERTYQRCFCQMLIGQGYRIVHSTEHTPLELGKDVIAVSSDDKIVGFQLKGNPGKSPKPSQFDEIRSHCFPGQIPLGFRYGLQKSKTSAISSSS